MANTVKTNNIRSACMFLVFMLEFVRGNSLFSLASCKIFIVIIVCVWALYADCWPMWLFSDTAGMQCVAVPYERFLHSAFMELVWTKMVWPVENWARSRKSRVLSNLTGSVRLLLHIQLNEKLNVRIVWVDREKISALLFSFNGYHHIICIYVSPFLRGCA